MTRNKTKRIISMLLLFAMVIGFIPVGMIETHAYELKMPERVRPTKETMWNPEFIRNTYSPGQYYTTIFINENNEVMTLGYGYGANAVKVPNLTDIVAVSGGGISDSKSNYGHSVALKSDGTVWTWGDNSNGQLGDGTTTTTKIPVQVKGGESGEEYLIDIVAISAGSGHSLALKADGTVFAWGYNSTGCLGNGTKTRKNVPVKVQDLDDVVAIFAGGHRSFAIKSDGTLWAWGRNDNGKLGDGTTIERTTPVQVVGLTDVVDVHGSFDNTYALKSDGTMWHIYNENTKVLSDVISIANYLAIKSDRTVWQSQTNVKVFDDAISLNSGRYANFAIKSDGTVWAWGANKDRQLGVGDTTDKVLSPSLSSQVSSQMKVKVNHEIDKIYNIKNNKKYGSWGNIYFGKSNSYSYTGEDYFMGFSLAKHHFSNIAINDDQIRLNEVLPNNQLIIIDNYGMIRYYKNITTDQPTTIPFDGKKVTKIELGHIDGLGLLPFLYTNDGFIHYIDQNDNQVRMLPVFQSEIKGTMAYHEKSNKSKHFLFIKNDGSLVYIDSNRIEQSIPVNMNDVAQIIPATHARPDYFLMKDGTLKTLTGNVDLPEGLIVTNLLSNRFVELSDGFVYSMENTSVKNTNTMNFMVQGATNDLLWLQNGQIMKLDLNGTVSYLNDVNGKLVKSIVKIDENSTFILMLDNTTKSYGDMEVGDLISKGIDYTKVVGFVSNNTGKDMLFMVTDDGKLYDYQGNNTNIIVSSTVLDEIIEDSDFTFDPTAYIEALIAEIELRIENMKSIDEAEEIQGLINKIPYNHQEDKNRLQQMLIDKIAELMGGIDKVAPILVIENNPTEWTNEDALITITAIEEENGSGIKEITLANGNKVTPTEEKALTLTTEYTITTNGSYTFKVEDNANNVTTETIVVDKIDKVAPTKPSIAKVDNELVLTPATDALSGIDKHMYSLNNADWLEFNSDIDITNFAPGNYTIKVKAIDNASNESEIFEYSFIIEDKTNNDLLEANEAVEKAEDTKFQEDVDSARDLVNKLPDGKDKDDLNDRLDAIQKDIDDNKELDDKIKEIEDDINNADGLDDLDNIQEKIDSLPDGEDKDRLQDELDDKRKELEDKANQDTLTEATEAVEKAESTKTQEDVDSARDKVNKLPDGKDKDDLNDRLDAIQKEIDDKKAHDDKVKEIEDAIKDMTDPSEADDIQKEIDKLPDGDDKDRLQDELDNKVTELEEQEELNLLLQEAIEAVERAESTRTQEDVDSARNLVNKLPNGNDKTNLNNRLDVVQNEINYKKTLEEATKAVEKAEETISQEDVNNAYKLVNKLPNGQDKTDLINRLKEVEKKIAANLAKEKAEKEAIQSVELAESLKREPYIQNAKDKVANLPDGELKDALEDRLTRLEELLNADSEVVIKSVETLVKTAEALKREPHITKAREAVNKLKPSDKKTELTERLDALEGKAPKDKALLEATGAVERAEEYGYASLIRKAEELVSKLPDSADKVALMDRLNKLKKQD